MILSSNVYTKNWNIQFFCINLQSLVGNRTFSWEAQTAWAKKSHGLEQFSGLRSSENENKNKINYRLYFTNIINVVKVAAT